MEEVKVTFQPDGKRVYALTGMKVIEAAARAGIIIDTPCGRQGNCGQCRVEIISADLPTPEEERHLTPQEIKRGLRLACLTKISKETTIHIPEEVRLHRQKILSTGRKAEVVFSPSLRKIPLELPRPTLERPGADWENLLSSLKPFISSSEVDIYLVRDLPNILRQNDFKVTAICENGRFIGLEAGDTSKRNFGLALDIGTTTVVGTLIDLTTGRELAVAADMNSQVVYGDDTISRLDFASQKEEGLNKLNSRIIEVTNKIIAEVGAKAGIDPHDIYSLTAVGNTAMQHLFLGISPVHLGVSPFVSAIRQAVSLNSQKVRLDINPQARLYFLPNIAGFVGADTVGVIMATGLDRADKLKMAIDIGTNGEVVLGWKERMLVCSTAAGPAFEGARITCGMRAAAGAIEKVIINQDDLSYEVIEGLSPYGLCGSGLLDMAAEMRKKGLMDETGRILNPDEVRSQIGPEILKRLRGNSFFIAEVDGRVIEITQRDIRQFQLAKAAIRTGIEILKKRLGVKDEDISELYLAGAFGNYIHPENALAIGLIPKIPLERIKFVGNAASEGAKMALISQAERERAEDISRKAEHVELATDPCFNEEFVKAMFFN